MTSEATDPALNGRTVGHVFISYSSSDRAIVNAAARLLRAGGATVFQDVVDIEFGARWKDALFDALNRCERVMVAARCPRTHIVRVAGVFDTIKVGC